MEQQGNNFTCICMFCCRQISNISRHTDLLELKHNAIINSKPRFLELLKRFLGAKNEWQRTLQTLNNESLQLESCQDCYTVISSFGDLYHKLKCLELHLEWKIQTLMCIMKAANRVPSRVKTIKELFISTDQNGIGNSSFEHFMKTRHEIVMKCAQKQGQVFPRISLKRLNLPSHTQNNQKTEFVGIHNFEISFVSWFMSFTAVLTLLTTTSITSETLNKQNAGFAVDMDEFLENSSTDLELHTPSFPEESEVVSGSVNTDSDNLPCSTVYHDVLEAEINAPQQVTKIPVIPNLGFEDLISNNPIKNSENDSQMPLAEMNAENEERNASIILETHTLPVQKESQVTSSVNTSSDDLPCETEFLTVLESETNTFPDSDNPATIPILSKIESSNEPEEFLCNSPIGNSAYSKNDLEIDSTSLTSSKDGNSTRLATIVSVDIKGPEDIKREIILETEQSSEAEKLRNKSELMFHCQYCSKRYSKQAGLSHHININHDKHALPFFCKLCNRRFFQHSKYLVHCKTMLHRSRAQIEIDESSNFLNNSNVMEVKNENDNINATSSSSSEEESDSPQKKYNLRSRETLKRKKKNVLDSESSSSESSDISCSDNQSSETSDEETSLTRKPRHSNTNSKYMRCTVEDCTYHTSNKLLYQDHQKLHEPGEFRCNFCKVVEESAFNLSLHEEQQHSKIKRKPGIYKCSRCPLQISSRIRYAGHFAAKHLGFSSSKNEFCKICKVTVAKKSNGKTHFEMNHDISKMDPEKIVKCSVVDCNAYFSNILGLIKHRHQVHIPDIFKRTRNKKENFICGICRIHFLTKLELAKHFRDCHKRKHIYPSTLSGASKIKFGRKFGCLVPNCLQSFREEESLQKHKKLHGQFACNFCKLTFDYAPNLSVHELEHNVNPAATDRYKCPRCTFEWHLHHKFQYITHHLEQHMELTDKVIVCKICDYRCRRYIVLEQHNTQSHKITENKSGKIRGCCKCSAYFLKDVQLYRHQISRHGYIYCQKDNCTGKSKGLREFNEHKKLHGNFKCQFCEIVKEYAPDLSLHEILEHNTENAQSCQNIKCPLCLFTSNEQGDVVTHHLKVHLKLLDKGFVCAMCGKQFDTWKHRKLHFEQNHGKIKKSDRQWQCIQCLATFMNMKELMKHKTSHPVYTCSFENCKATYKSEKELEDHTMWHGEFTCQFCNVCVNYAPDLAKHEMQLHGLQKSRNNTYKCSRCSYSSILELRCANHFLEAHLSIVSKIVRCSICNFAGYTQSAVIKHFRNFHRTNDRSSNESYACDQCSVSFVKPVQLFNHKQKEHPDSVNNLLYCKICDKSYKTRPLLYQHTKKFHGQDQTYTFVCSFPNCNRRFETKIELERHKAYAGKSHFSETEQPTAKETFFCEQCGKHCIGSTALKVHKKVHREGRPSEFKCDQCNKIFKSKAHLQIHREFHKGPDQWKFVCDICSKRCASKKGLEEHTRTHTKEKPLCCQLCGEKYAHRHNLRNHMKSKHKEVADQDAPKTIKRRFYVSRKGKKLGREFCFTRDEDNRNQN